MVVVTVDGDTRSVCIKPQIEQIRPFSLGHGVAAAAHVEIVLRLRLGLRLWLGLRVRLLIGAAVKLALGLDGCVAALWLAGGRIVV